MSQLGLEMLVLEDKVNALLHRPLLLGVKYQKVALFVDIGGLLRLRVPLEPDQVLLVEPPLSFLELLCRQKSLVVVLLIIEDREQGLQVQLREEVYFDQRGYREDLSLEVMGVFFVEKRGRGIVLVLQYVLEAVEKILHEGALDGLVLFHLVSLPGL
jgi:hypothetical protein